MRVRIGMMAVLLFGGCITTFQTAEVLPKGESVVGVGTINLFAYEGLYRRGIGNNIDVGIKGGLAIAPNFDILTDVRIESPISPIIVVPMVSGEVKRQITDKPLPVAVMLGVTSLLVEGETAVIIYPTLLASYRGLYAGARLMFVKFSEKPGLAFVTGVGFRPFKGRMAVFPEVTVLAPGDVLLGLGLQWDVRPLKPIPLKPIN